MAYTFLDFLWDKFRPAAPVVKKDLQGKNVVVIGANTGIGFEAAKHFASMNPARLILGCRSKGKGRIAIEEIERATGYLNTTLWIVDLNEFSSVVAFADKFEDITLDIVVANAGVACETYETSPDGWEQTLQVNHLSTALLSLLLLPRLKEAATKGSAHPRLVIVSSEGHHFVNIPERVVSTPNILEAMNREDYCKSRGMLTRYFESKLMNVFVVHAIASRLPTTSPIIVNAVHPGYCKSGLTRQAKFPKKTFASISEFLFARSCEEGSRSLIWAAIGTPSGTRDKEDGESVRLLQGEYIAHAQILGCSSYASSEEGKAVGERIWAETVDILSKASSKVSTIVESLNS